MNEEEAKNTIDRLTAIIQYHNTLYHEHARPEISDYEFDQLLAGLTQLEEQFPELRREDSPTQHVGGTISKNFATVPHKYPMLSLSNTYSIVEVREFIARIQRLLSGASIEFFCELKFDGIAISIFYQQGILKRVATRGDGIQGDDITHNAIHIKTIPKIIQAQGIPDAFEVRGEALMPFYQFEALNQIKIANHQKSLANPRNATAGMLRTLKPSIASCQILACYPYALRADGIPLNTHEEGIRWLEKWGFNVSPTYRKCTNIAEVIKYIKYWETHKKDLPVAIDGIVIKVNNLEQQDRLGFTAKNPRWSIAYKYKPAHIATRLENVVYQVGRTGVITPVAHMKPVLLAGTTVKRASLHNAREIERLGLHIGDIVFIEKSGDIIPKITGVDTTQQKPYNKLVKFITHCPACGTMLIKPENQALYYCPNKRTCLPQNQATLEHFVHKKAMDIQAVGKKTLALLLQKGLVRTPADLYVLRYEDMHALDGFQDLSTRNLLRGIEQSKQQPFERVLFALGIRYVGEVVAQKIAYHYHNIDDLAKAKREELTTIPEVGEIIANSIFTYFQVPDNLQLIEALKNAGLKLSKATPEKLPQNSLLADKSFVISGTFQHWDRETLRNLIRSKRGKVLSSISRKLDYLIIGNNPGPAKLAQAQKLAIPIIDETRIVRMLGSS